MPVKLNSSGGGSVTIDTPSTASNLSLTLPSSAGTLARTADLPSGFGFKNRIINGAMTVDQRNNGNSLTPTNGQYSLDRYECAVNVANKMSVRQVNEAPAGFSYSLKVTSLSSYSIGVGEVATVRQKIEGYNIADLAWGTADAQAVTLSFRVRSSLTGTFSGVLSNDNDRTYAFTYTINAANTWETKSVTIPGPTSGTFGATNGIGFVVLFTLACGSNFMQTPGSWLNTNNYGATGTTNLLGTNAATWQVTGVQLEVGSTATSFDYRPYGTELQLCQRYYYKSTGTDYGLQLYTVNGSPKQIRYSFGTPMRATPTVSAINTGLYAYGTPTTGGNNSTSFYLAAVGTGDTPEGYFFAGIIASAEL